MAQQIVPAGSAASIEPASIAEQLLYLTVKIVGRNSKGEGVGGTGFFYLIELEKNQSSIILVTNQHVIRDMVGGVDIRVHSRTTTSGALDGISTIHLEGSLGNGWIAHPRDLDLCAYPVQQKLNTAPSSFTATLGKGVIPSADALFALDAIEEIIMVGYPALISDEKNSYPIIRRGITATHPAIDFDGKPETAIDMPVIGGSSGSPVLIYYSGASRLDKRNNYIAGSRAVLFLGILWGGAISNAQGEIQITEAPTFLGGTPNVITGRFGYSVPINIGYMIKSREMFPLVDAVAKTWGLRPI